MGFSLIRTNSDTYVWKCNSCGKEYTNVHEAEDCCLELGGEVMKLKKWQPKDIPKSPGQDLVNEVERLEVERDRLGKNLAESLQKQIQMALDALIMKSEIKDLNTELELTIARNQLNPLPGDNMIHDEAEIRRLYAVAREARERIKGLEAELARCREMYKRDA